MCVCVVCVLCVCVCVCVFVCVCVCVCVCVFEGGIRGAWFRHSDAICDKQGPTRQNMVAESQSTMFTETGLNLSTLLSASSRIHRPQLYMQVTQISPSLPPHPLSSLPHSHTLTLASRLV